MRKVSEIKVREMWNILHKAHAIYQQVLDEGIDVDSTDWYKLRDDAWTIDSDNHEHCNTPMCFFIDTIDHAISCEITYENYLQIIKCYGINLEA